MADTAPMQADHPRRPRRRTGPSIPHRPRWRGCWSREGYRCWSSGLHRPSIAPPSLGPSSPSTSGVPGSFSTPTPRCPRCRGWRRGCEAGRASACCCRRSTCRRPWIDWSARPSACPRTPCAASAWCMVVEGTADDSARCAVMHYLRPTERDGQGHIQRRPPAVLSAWDDATSAFEDYAWAVTPELADRVDRSQADFEESLARPRPLPGRSGRALRSSGPRAGRHDQPLPGR